VLASNYSAYTLELNPQKIADVDAAIDGARSLKSRRATVAASNGLRRIPYQ
jgi:hypothetical protein